MKKNLSISDKIILSPLWLLTLLPLEILYFFSDIIFLLTFYVIRYRRAVVDVNLENSFPEKNERERKKLARLFYHYLCDYFLESIYLLNMPIEECNRRYKYTNPELLNTVFKQNRSIILATSHYGNWEWATNFQEWFPHTLYGIYKPLSNKVFDRLFIYMRERYGTIPIPMKHTLRTISECKARKELFAMFFVADQRPPKSDLKFWTRFMNQETPVITGMDKLARRYDLPVIFMNTLRTRRGYYEVTFELIIPEPEKTKPNEIARQYIQSVERLIRKQPEFYLWSHKRWKYKPEIYKKQKGTE